HSHQELFTKVQAFAYIRTLAVMSAWEIFIADEPEISEKVEIMWDYIFGAQIIGESLGFSLTPEHVTPVQPDPNYLVLSLGEGCFTYDRIAALLESSYGEHAVFLFKITQMVFMASIITDMYRQVKLRDAAKERKKEV